MNYEIELALIFTENITEFYIQHGNLLGKLCDTEYSGSNELGLHLIITKISDVLKEADVLEGSINRGDEWIVLPPRSPWCLTAILVRKRYCSERKHDNNSVLSIRPVPFTESGKKCYFQSF